MKLLLLAALSLTSVAAVHVVQDPQDTPKPLPQHALLTKHVGVWDAVVIAHMPDGTEQRNKGKMTTRKLADFHTIDDFESEFMGAPFVGHGTNSYCPVRKKYLSTWIDSMTGAPMLLLGDYDEKTKELTMVGEAFGQSGKLEPCRAVTRFVDDEHFHWSFFGAGPDGKEMQFMRIEYTRRK